MREIFVIDHIDLKAGVKTNQAISWLHTSEEIQYLMRTRALKLSRLVPSAVVNIMVFGCVGSLNKSQLKSIRTLTRKNSCASAVMQEPPGKLSSTIATVQSKWSYLNHHCFLHRQRIAPSSIEQPKTQNTSREGAPQLINNNHLKPDILQ